MRSVFIVFLSLCLMARGDQIVSEKQQAIFEAVKILESEGLLNLCHPVSDEFSPTLPLCNVNRKPYLPSHRDRFLNEEEDEENKTKWFYISNGIGALVCVSVSALAAGLTVGLLSLDPLFLLIKMRAGATEKEKAQAAALAPIIKERHRLLVTLLLLSSVAGEALPIFLSDLVPEIFAVLLSVILVLFFGEILPAAIFTGPNQIKMASALAPVVRAVMWLLFPIAYPIARVLDFFLHEENHSDDSEDENDGVQGNFYNRGELAALIRIQHEERMAAKQRRWKAAAHLPNPEGDVKNAEFATTLKTLKTEFAIDNQDPMQGSFRNLQQTSFRILQQGSNKVLSGQESKQTLKEGESSNENSRRSHYRRSSSIHNDEVMIMEGALQMKTKVAMDVLTSFKKVFAIPYDMILNEKNIVRIYGSGYSRVPVYERQQGGDKKEKENSRKAIRGILMTRQLIVVNTNDDCPVSKLPLHVPVCVSPDMNLVDLVNMFQTGGMFGKGGHMALVCARPELGNAALDDNEAVPEEAGFMGIITLEDVLEAVLQEQIYDEMDVAGRVGAPDEIQVEDSNDEGGYSLV